MLDQIEIRGRDAQPARQFLLRQALFLTQAANDTTD
jgi:hypothetical protein